MCYNAMKLWYRIVALLVVLYIVLCMVAYVFDVLSVNVSNRPQNKKEFYDGPLVMKELPNGKQAVKVLQSVVVLQAKQGDIDMRPADNSTLPPPHVSAAFYKVISCPRLL